MHIEKNWLKNGQKSDIVFEAILLNFFLFRHFRKQLVLIDF